VIGTRVGLAVGPRVGIAAGINADPIAPPPSSSVIAGVTRDALSRVYCPSSPAEWTAFMAAAPLATGNPQCAWTCQDPGGTPTDVMGGGVPLAPNAAPAFQSPVAGWARTAIRFTDGAASQRLFNNFSVPDPSLTSTLAVAIVDFPAVAPAGVRGLIAKTATTPRLALSTTGRLQLVDGATAELASSVLGGVHVLAFQTNLTAGTSKVFTDQEKFTGTFTVPAAGAFLGFGGVVPAAAAGVALLYLALFAGAAAELVDAQVKTLLQTMGFPIPWT